MAGQDLVRPSRDGDQFHYHWAARQCLELLPGGKDLQAVTIEGSSSSEANGDNIDAGEQLIDVGLYYGSERRDDARLVRYIQLKHSTRHAHDAWTASGLEKTIRGFAERYAKLLERYSAKEVAQRFRFEFTTNRPIDSKLKAALEYLASKSVARHPDLHQTLIGFTSLDMARASGFFSLFNVEGSEGDLWAQRNLLTQDLSAYLPDADYDAPVQLKELVTRKATTEFESDPSIRRHDVLRALKATEEQLQPAPCLIPDSTNALPREQEREFLLAFFSAKSPIVIYADGGVGKSVLASRLAVSIPLGSVAILYDCFGDGLYRNALHFRHRHRDALVQIANELAARSLCHPLIPTVHADTKQYMRAFIHRLAQAAALLRSRDSDACLCLIIDAADNAEMAAEEQREPGSFVRDLIRAPLPEGVRLAFTCRTHRRWRLSAPPGTQELELRSFSARESVRHLRTVYPAASDAEAGEFAFLSSSNPRVQALALSQRLALQEMLKQLGPNPTTVDSAIGDLLEAALARLRDQASMEASQIDVICQGLAVLRPLVPIGVLAQLSGTSEGAIRSFALDLGRPLLVKGDSLHFLDEPAETWFRERFQPDAQDMTRFLERLRPLTLQSSYAAAALPHLLLQAEKLDELVLLALSGEGLPTESPLARRDVELQRLNFALKACLQQGRHMAAAKLALKAGGECAGEQRQNSLIQDHTDLAAVLMAPDRIEEIVSRRTFGSGWMGSHHVYDAGLLSGREELSAVAASRLRMAFDWLRTWARLPDEERRREDVSDADRAELAMALLRLRSAKAAAGFLRSWTWRPHAFDAGARLGRRLIDLGRYDQLDDLTEAAGNDVWLLLALAREARAVGHLLPAAPLARLLRLLADRRVKLQESQQWNANWNILYAVSSAIEIAVRVLPSNLAAWAAILWRYLPSSPPTDFTSRHGFDRAPLLRAYALAAALRGQVLSLIDVAPAEVRKQLESGNQYGRSQETEIFLQEVGGLLPWSILSAQISCGQMPSVLSDAIEAALKETFSMAARSYREVINLRQSIALAWLQIMGDAATVKGPEIEAFRSWTGSQKTPLWLDTLTTLCRNAARVKGLESLALEFAAEAYQVLESSREDAETRADSYLRLARAILAVSPSEAGVFFDRAVEIANRIGDENLYRWAALLHLAQAAGEHGKPRPMTAYRLSRVAELTYEYVARDKHFDWDSSVEALTDLCASSCLAILSRWRDRRFGDPGRLLPTVVYRLIERSRLPVITPIAFAGLEARWNRLADLKRVCASETDPIRRSVAAHVAYRYMRVQPGESETWSEIGALGKAYGLDFPDIHRLISANHLRDTTEMDSSRPVASNPDRDRRSPDWEEIFLGVDLTNSDALLVAYAAVRTYDSPYEFEAFFREAFARISIGREPELVRAIASWPDFGMFELRYLLDALPTLPPKQMSFRNALRDAVLSACRREPERVRRRGWGALIPFEKLDQEGLLSNGDVTRATLEGFAAHADMLGASALFQLVAPLATCLSPEEADDTLNFGMDLLEDILRPEDGDGEWRSDLEPSHSVISAVAGYVWAGLSSPVVAERWEYAHVVRCMVELGWSELLEALTKQATTDSAGPFADQGLDFYVWHARQWLLIGLARGGLENAGALRPCVPLLQRWLCEEHVLIQELAAHSLRTLVAAGELKADEEGNLDSVNQPNIPEEVYTGWSGFEADEPSASEEALNDDAKYYFGIDIGPYWFSPLGRAFGLSEEAIECRARQALRRHMGWNGVKHQEDARYKRRIFSDGETNHSHGSMPKTDDLRAYHGYHAMMQVAAVLLKQRPVRRRADEAQNEFQEWLTNHLLTRSDGQWLADRRDPTLVAQPPSAEGYGDKLWRWGVTADHLDRQLTTDDGLTVLWGHWSSGSEDHNESVSIRSALVSMAGAESLLAALQTAPEFGRYSLPAAIEREDLEAGVLKLTGWVTDEHISARLDEGDPWAEGLHFPGPAPSRDLVMKLGLTASSDGRRWQAEHVCLRSETWTHVRGYGRNAESVSGFRLSGDNGFLERLFETHPDCRLVLSVEIRRRSSRHRQDEDEFEAYYWPYTRYFLMGGDGVAHTI
ncbi:NACHT domain-containing protein [Rhodocyclus tenuis]|uniref:NACHT domain-containing protein n=1 Tax=Rhodocyclus tenuis TaxID=1066 RepID=UPI001903C164|nr:NACHT domain-containing protein [Rhodocyclus tenuis]MBK1680759.1 hypothetical protein [Rhodocyclus tenuis]